MGADHSIAMVSLQRKDRLNHIQDVFRSNVSERISNASKGFFFVVGAPHATAHINIATLQLS